MKFLEIKTDNGEFTRFSLDTVMTYGIKWNAKEGRKSAHWHILVRLKPVKELDSGSYGVIIDYCYNKKWEFGTIDMALKAMSIIDA